MLDSVSISIQFVEKVRVAVGDELPLMLDLAVPKDLDQTNLLEEVSSFNPYWIEEPVDGENISLLTEIKNSFNMKVVTGEKQSGLVHFRELIHKNAADIFNPDISGMGGLVDIIKISNEASNNGIPFLRIAGIQCLFQQLRCFMSAQVFLIQKRLKYFQII